MAQDDPWGILERFGQELEPLQDYSEQERLLLQAVRNLLNADVVFLWNGTTNAVGDIVGSRGLAPEWCRKLAASLVKGSPAAKSQVLHTRLQYVVDGQEGPRSAALMRLSKSKERWVTALSFDSDTQFQVADINWMSLARQIFTQHVQHQRVYGQLKEAVLGLVHSFTTAIDAKDHYTQGHSERVARIAVRLAQQMGLSRSIVSDLYLAGLLHDVGKIGTRDSVLLKQGELTPEEWAHIKEHPVLGDKIVSGIKQLAHLCPGIRNHHERWDGKGYPDGLAGDAIPPMARILAVADACDAMMSDRPYRTGMPRHQINVIMDQGAGKQWDAAVIAAFKECKYDLFAIYAKGIGQSVLHAVDDAVDANRHLMHAELS